MAETAEPIILWGEVDKRLPLHQDPECRQQRKELFKRLLGKGHKTLTLDDVQKGMKAELRYDMAGSYVPGVKEMTKTIKYAFKISSELAPSEPKSNAKAKKGPQSAKIDTNVAHAKSKKKKDDDAKGKSVDKREFHCFLTCLRYCLEMDELFEQMDGAHDDDQKLSLRECRKGSAKFAEWGISEDMLKDKFAGVDSWVAHLKFDDFLDWVMGVRMAANEVALKLDDSDNEEVQFYAAKEQLDKSVDITFHDLGAESDVNRMKVMEAFTKWDSDGSGGITVEEMAAVMRELNPDFTDTKVRLLFEAADSNMDGLIDFDEFLAFVFR